MDLGVLAAAGPLAGVLFGLGTVRARVLPRPAGVSLSVSARLPVVVAVLPHAMRRVAAVPTGLGFAWLEYALWPVGPAFLPAVTSPARPPGESLPPCRPLNTLPPQAGPDEVRLIAPGSRPGGVGKPGTAPPGPNLHFASAGVKQHS